jgi:hypothetical protein
MATPQVARSEPYKCDASSVSQDKPSDNAGMLIIGFSSPISQLTQPVATNAM